MQAHLIGNECPIEFFVEGQRSRTSKSLYPKFGLVQVVAEPFLRSHVYDTVFTVFWNWQIMFEVVVPVTINYDRLLESFLYGRELLGSPKPKETVSGTCFFAFLTTVIIVGLLKVRQVLNQKFGSVFITFAEPISLRQYFAHIDRASISFRVILQPNDHNRAFSQMHTIFMNGVSRTRSLIWPMKLFTFKIKTTC